MSAPRAALARLVVRDASYGRLLERLRRADVQTVRVSFGARRHGQHEATIECTPEDLDRVRELTRKGAGGA